MPGNSWQYICLCEFRHPEDPTSGKAVDPRVCGAGEKLHSRQYYAKMEFASYGYEVYTSEVDDHGVDFVVKVPETNRFYEVQVKSVRNYGYVFIPESKMKELTPYRLVCCLHFLDDKLPDVFVIPATSWEMPNELLVHRKYDKPGLTSKPEYGINISRKNYSLLNPYCVEEQLSKMKETAE